MSVKPTVLRIQPQPYRPATTSPVYFTETSTQMTVSPRSLLTPSPRLLSTELCSPERKSCPCNTPNNTRATAESDVSRVSHKPRLSINPEAGLRLGRSITWGKPFAEDWNRVIVTTVRPELEKELKITKNALSEKDKFVCQLQQIILNLEGDLKQVKEKNSALIQENRNLVEKIKQVESSLKEQVNTAISRLSAMLTDNANRIRSVLVRPVTVPSQTCSDSQEFCAFLMEENRRLSDELKGTKKELREELVSLLEPLGCELAGIEGDVVQLRALIKGAKAGEQVRLDVLWSSRRSPDPGCKSESYTQVLKREVTSIKAAVADMKRMAADLYAEQCGQTCAPQ